MIIAIAALIIGILGFIKGRINVSKNRELRGGGMYAVATLFCLPLPLSFLIGVVLGASAAANRTALDQHTVLLASALATWGPLILAFILAFAMSKPKVPAGPPPQGFEVKM